MVANTRLFCLINAVAGSNVARLKDDQKASGRETPSELPFISVQSQVALSVVDMPEAIGNLLDRGLEDYFRGR